MESHVHILISPVVFPSASLELPFSPYFALLYSSGSTATTAVVPPALSSGSTAPSGSTALRTVVPLGIFGCSTAVCLGYFRLDSRTKFFVSGFAALRGVVGAVVPPLAVVPLFPSGSTALGSGPWQRGNTVGLSGSTARNGSTALP